MSLTPEGNATHQIRVTRLSVGPVDDDELTTHIEIMNEGDGEFVEVIQPRTRSSQLRIAADEWPVLRETIEWMIAECRTANEQTKGNQ